MFNSGVVAVPRGFPPLPRCPSGTLSMPHFLAFSAIHFLLINFRSESNSEPRAVPSMLQHYFIVWLAICTSPRGIQLDAWLLLLCAMDLGPMLFAVASVLWKGLDFAKSEEGFFVILDVMSAWSPAYQFNHLVLNLVSGSFIDHAYVILVFTMVITQGHRLFINNVYCY